MKSAPRFTREVLTALEAKLAVKITPEDNQNVVFTDESLNYAVTLDPRAAHQLGHALIQAARIAAMNTLDPTPVRSISVHVNDHDSVHLRSDQ